MAVPLYYNEVGQTSLRRRRPDTRFCNYSVFALAGECVPSQVKPILVAGNGSARRKGKQFRAHEVDEPTTRF